MPRDRRYTIQREWTGHARPQHVVRFCNGWVGAASSARQARALRATHAAGRAAVIAALASPS